MKVAASALVSMALVFGLLTAKDWMHDRATEDLKLKVRLLEGELKTCKATRDVEAGVIQACFNAKGAK